MPGPQALGSRDFRAFLEDSVAHVLPVFVAGSKAAAVERLAALCDQFEVLLLLLLWYRFHYCCVVGCCCCCCLSAVCVLLLLAVV